MQKLNQEIYRDSELVLKINEIIDFLNDKICGQITIDGDLAFKCENTIPCPLHKDICGKIVDEGKNFINICASKKPCPIHDKKGKLKELADKVMESITPKKLFGFPLHSCVGCHGKNKIELLPAYFKFCPYCGKEIEK